MKQYEGRASLSMLVLRAVSPFPLREGRSSIQCGGTLLSEHKKVTTAPDKPSTLELSLVTKAASGRLPSARAEHGRRTISGIS